jgi:hypothetical protein
MRNLVLCGSILISLGEAGYIGFVLGGVVPVKSPFFFGATAGILWLYLTTGAFFLWLASRDKLILPFFPTLGKSVQSTSDPHKTNLWVHSFYHFLNLVNALMLLFSFFIAVAVKTWTPNWGVLAGLTVILSVYYNRLIFSGLGQRSEDNRGSSFVLAASLAKLSSKMFEKKDRRGLSPLLQTLRILDTLFTNRRYRPRQLPSVQTTVEGLTDLEVEGLPFDTLERLAESLTRLPRREEIAPAFDRFLTEMKWPGEFERVEHKRVSGYELATILVFAATAIGSFLLFVPRTVQDAAYDAISSFVVAQGANSIGVALVFVGIFYWPFVARYETYFDLLLRYRSLATPLSSSTSSEPAQRSN